MDIRSLLLSAVFSSSLGQTHNTSSLQRYTLNNQWAIYLTAITVGFDPITILQPVAPSAVISSGCVVALPDAIPTLKTMTPLSAVDPLSFILHTEPMALPLGPVAFIGIPTRPGVHPYYLKAVRPGPGILALALGSGADAMSVGFAILPPPAVSATVVEVKPSARHSDKR